MSAYELEALPEFEEEFEWESAYEGEYEGDHEGEFEADGESEEFFRRLSGLARRATQSPALRRIALTAARRALSGMGPVGSVAAGLVPQGEFEGEYEGEFEGAYEEEYEYEGELNPVRRVYPDALMEHLGHAAATARTEAESEAFIGALVPLAARLIPQVAPVVMRAAPQLVRGVAGVAKTLRSNPTTRPLVRAIPTIVQRTTANLARQVATGRPVTPQTAVRTLARQTANVLGNPRRSVQAYQRSRALDRRFHQVARSPKAPIRIPGRGLCPC